MSNPKLIKSWMAHLTSTPTIASTNCILARAAASKMSAGHVVRQAAVHPVDGATAEERVQLPDKPLGGGPDCSLMLTHSRKRQQTLHLRNAGSVDALKEPRTSCRRLGTLIGYQLHNP